MLLAAFCEMKAQDSLWIRYDNRFQANKVLDIKGADSMEVKSGQLKVYLNDGKTRSTALAVDKSAVVFANPGRCVRLPMIGEARSLNLSNTVAVGVYEVLRQWKFPALQWQGELHHGTWDEVEMKE